VRSPFRLSAHRPDALLATQPDVSVDPSLGRITLVGELDRQTGHRLLDVARTLAARGHTHWLIDAHDPHFCDASGVRAISVIYRGKAGSSRWTGRTITAGRLPTRAGTTSS
jgi:hypothetical protein